MKPIIAVVLFLLLCFQIAVAQDFSFVAFGDTGEGNTEQYLVSKAVENECLIINCEFGVLLGDNFYDVGVTSVDDPQFRLKFELPYENINFPFYITLGNHDYGRFANDWKRGSYQIQYSQINPKWILPSYYYSFSHNDVLFIVLDTSRFFHDKDTKKQRDFIRETLKNRTEKWLIVVGHHPYLSNGSHGNAGKYDGVLIPPYSGSVIKKLIEDELCPHMDLYLNGHDHNLQTILGKGKCENVPFVTSGAGAKFDDELEGKNESLFQKAIYGFTTISVRDENMEVTHVNVHGQREHTLIITK